MFNPTNTFPNTVAGRGTKFFAQAIRAFLDEESFEGFRAYSLDTVARLREADELIASILAKRVHAPALGPVLEELRWSIENDEGALHLAPTDCQTVIELCFDQKTPKKTLRYGVKLLERRLAEKYKEALISIISESINEDKRIRILSATGYLVSHLLNQAHNRDFLLYHIDRKFFKSDVNRAGAAVVRSFLSGLTDRRRQWIVIHAVNPAAASLLKAFKDWTVSTESDLPPHAQEAVKDWPALNEPPMFAFRREEATDPFEASLQSQSELERAKALRILAADPMSPAWTENSYVYAPRAKGGHDILTRQTPLIGGVEPKTLSGHRLRQAQNLASRIYQNFDEASKDRITRALSTAAVAIDSPQVEIRLTSLWSSFEVLLGDPPEEEPSRIAHFVKSVSPCISVRYHRRLFVALHDQMVVHYRKKFSLILDRVHPSIKSNRHTMFAKLVVLPEYDALMKEVLYLASDDPLMVHRLWRLHKYYSTPKDAVRSIKGHNDRVVWQLHRIYRVRNSFVHSGQVPPFAGILALNALEYLRSSVMAIVRRSSKTGGPADVDQIVAEIGFSWKAMIKSLEAERADFNEQLAHTVFSAF